MNSLIALLEVLWNYLDNQNSKNMINTIDSIIKLKDTDKGYKHVKKLKRAKKHVIVPSYQMLQKDEWGLVLTIQFLNQIW